MIVGSSFIGMEAAAYMAASKKIKSITVIGMEKYPFERVLGTELGQVFAKLHSSKGIKLIPESVVSSFVGAMNGMVTKAIVKNVVSNEEVVLDADVVIVGAGVVPATAYLRGVDLGPMGAIKVDEHVSATYTCSKLPACIPNNDTMFNAIYNCHNCS